MKKIALVTGASSGIGWDIAEYLNSNGITVVAAARRLEKMAPLKKQGIYTIQMDVGDSPSMDAGLEEIRGNVGEIDILINNAGVMYMAPAELADMDEIRHLYDINVFSVIELTQKCLPHMREQGWGRILNVTSVGGVGAMPFNNVYGSGKFALEGWTRMLKQEVRQFGVGVSCIRPGSVKSEIYDDTFNYDDKDFSWTGPYEEDYVRVVKKLHSIDQRFGSPPRCVSEVVLEAINADSPKVSYTGPVPLGQHIEKEQRALTDDERDENAAKLWGM